VPDSLGLLPSGPDPVGERLVRRQPPGALYQASRRERQGVWRRIRQAVAASGWQRQGASCTVPPEAAVEVSAGRSRLSQVKVPVRLRIWWVRPAGRPRATVRLGKRHRNSTPHHRPGRDRRDCGHVTVILQSFHKHRHQKKVSKQRLCLQSVNFDSNFIKFSHCTFIEHSSSIQGPTIFLSIRCQ
jgi:hypothetical protein